ncbi:guanosine-3',5'-bis(diphosphate) 3'-pyrophosphohydrolase [Candidatus Photodesmus katoptron]|uniref:bifunctional GTP diphosphokinase/guanosine-3',5'-bis pyrophosphate 3'-pyrophosphohydrolase n=1 Tax=Candidatus Photodesmus anomalopis TaxID=28176 RepID=UPI0004D6B0C4|nr:bifunctional GTP diphosphokinase/guanosine-3',5'-bis pyrophosphate 3'-pyrophosphohydrolase [Candidatus Photodesmus katoptron]KEY90148.1 guanosine-3',5'-bis(diphosphate) 3'-pyrophosphohydrolase [Candidatus Photodesmus katoptron]
MYLFYDLKGIAQEYLKGPQIEALFRSYLIAKNFHKGQTRSSGDPYIMHPVAVSSILAEMRLDLETLQAALLHDVIEDCNVTKEELTNKFGKTVAELVDGVSKLDKLKFRDRKEAQAENFRKMVLAMVQDIRVILIKLADRIHNMRTLNALRPDKKRRIARETLEIYSPLAHRLGIHNIKTELEELGFEALYPDRYRVFKKVLCSARGNRKDIIQRIHNEIAEHLEQASLKARVLGREKNLFSIYNKMKSKEQRFHTIMDVYAFRVVVKDSDDCYRALGQIHNLYKPRPNRMKDYIAVPKANGYQSLHTSMVGPHGVPVEVQIRTEDMEQMADKGIAAHWSCTEGNNIWTGTTAQIKAQRWMQSLSELQKSADNSFEFIENVKSDLFPDEIYVFTPKGRIIELPVGATAVDFAYAVHTDVGNMCVGANVERNPYPLSKSLKNGQTIEILTAPCARPNASWLNYVMTSRARTKIRQILRTMRREESITLGRRLLNHALGDFSLSDITEIHIQRVLRELKLDNIEDLLAEIGLGELISTVVARRLLGDNITKTKYKTNITHKNKLPILGSEGMLLTFANCCHPIPNDHIIAYISPGRGLIVHREICPNIHGYQKEPDKHMAVKWSDDYKREFITELKIDTKNHHNSLAELINTISKTNSNIHGLSTEERNHHLHTVTVSLTTNCRKHLASIIKKIRVMPYVIKVKRR